MGKARKNHAESSQAGELRRRAEALGDVSR